MAEREDFIRTRRPVVFVDLFAGAGGFSEGFLQAYSESKYYRFVLASDINENCELTHRVRYNEQLGLDTKFITEDITSPSFLTKLREELAGIDVDVVTGGPCCQSFSLSGRRKRFDKRDVLFNHYLYVIRALRPKYFVMENV
ncbi:MAG: DNA cytosine methyltransferase, partial [Paludibacteraceae bacterium]|nr:DNA cytosine methyltransferase [Paludibacteraceae bacterium]